MRVAFLLFISLFALSKQAFCAPLSIQSAYRSTFHELEKTVSLKKSQLLHFLSRLEKKADGVSSDQVIANFFAVKNDYYKKYKKSQPPHDIKVAMQELKVLIQQHYLNNYLDFYDVLFINKAGDVFYTIRKEADYHKNIFQGELSKTNLSKTLRNYKGQRFVDFQYFYPSDEPAAFFIAPISFKGEQLGWCVLQSAINKINSLFRAFAELGQTGEVFLVNKQRFLLTDARLIGKETILQKSLSKKNIAAKFKAGRGNKTITDYRGFKALVSFEVVKFLGSEWLISAKIDQTEVLSNFYINNKARVLPLMLSKLKTRKTHLLKKKCPAHSDYKRVDMDEFVFMNADRSLYTPGVASCTAFTLSYPSKFAYLAHLSPYDLVYKPENMYTNLVGEIFKQVTTFDIYPYEKRNLKVYLVANHLKSFETALDLLLSNGLFLSQIYFLFNPDSKSASVQYRAKSDDICTEWTFKDGSSFVEDNKHLLPISKLMST